MIELVHNLIKLAYLSVLSLFQSLRKYKESRSTRIIRAKEWSRLKVKAAEYKSTTPASDISRIEKYNGIIAHCDEKMNEYGVGDDIKEADLWNTPKFREPF